ncbi:MAG: pyruvate, orthophosphate dikinase [Gaiellaceae bacterium]|jgi:pyruvate,orthophosphate dikinase|nr:pyruvate, orthophosphate dikinase [Gaiellaceae bacterium]
MRYVYDFDEDSGDGGRELLGGKGVGLAEMTALGVPVPAGFTITTDACRAYMASGGELPEGLEAEVAQHIASLESKAEKRFGDPDDPLLVSVRSGAAVSMPGMMDTILNLGLNDEAVAGLAKTTGNERFAYDSYRRLIQMYGEVVDGVEGHRFEQALTDMKAARGVKQDVELEATDLAELIETFKRTYAEETGSPFPQNARAQLEKAVRAVFDSWDSPRAQVYRRTYEIADDLGTAVNVVQMVFGNKGDGSGTGVCFTRDPSTGESRLYGEFLQNAQGEDVVAGIRTPEPIERMGELLPEAYAQLLATIRRLEEHYRDMQDIEFTVEEGKLFLLQTRSAKRTAAAALRAAVEMVEEGLISKEEAVARIDPAQLDQLLHPMIDPAADVQVVAKGLNASPGAASGAIVFDADTAEARGKAGESVILVRWETTPDDFHGMVQAAGILTAHGGLTSHAAVVARGMGTPCVTGCEALHVDVRAKTARLPGHELKEGDTITIDGGSGEVIVGEVPLVPPQINDDFAAVLEWADTIRRLRVRTNADNPADATKAREFGAEGIGLCRTEHMFADADRLGLMREMILAADEDGRRSALDRLLPIQQADFEGIFEAMAGLPVTIRLLDWPLHEFLPALEEEQDEQMRERIRALQESNPMLGFRACRLGLFFPEIYEMQVRAIVRAAIAVRERSSAAIVEIMIPLVGFGEELKRLRALTVRVAAEEGELDYLVGTMIELPRACVRADEIAEHADFFSFGTNDLTQTALGLSRDDAGRFLSHYLETGVIERDPFETIDQGGVGDLMEIAVERGRRTREDLKLGVCGEHGGEAKSVAFCHRLGLDYVSCSPYRVPLARLAAAQAALAEQGIGAVAIGG